MTATLPPEVVDTRELVQPALRQAVAELDPRLRRVVSYHLGWVDEHGQPDSAGGGKALRPAIALLAAEAVGGSAESALPGAVAVELVHNFSLLHDDVMDGDEQRRHRATVWRVFGTPAAILAGDALLTLAMEILDRAGAASASSCLTTAVQRLITGQALDVDFERRTDVTLEECLDMAAGKTAALMRCAAELGALLAGADTRAQRLTGEFGHHLGMAFQLVDDLLGIRGAPEVTGKPVLADLRVRKKSVPVVAALCSGTPEAVALQEFYRRPEPPTEGEPATMAELIERSGALAWTEDEAQRYLGSAQACLAELQPPPRVHAALGGLASYIVERDR
jgi:geranylgeranyl diphosphate synthase type I